MIIRIIPLIVSSILLGAHFLRDGNLILAAACVLIPLLLLIKKPWSLLATQGLMYVGVVIWLYTAYTMIQVRQFLGQDWSRLAIILGTVALFTLFSGLQLNSAVVKKRYYS